LDFRHTWSRRKKKGEGEEGGEKDKNRHEFLRQNCSSLPSAPGQQDPSSRADHDMHRPEGQQVENNVRRAIVVRIEGTKSGRKVLRNRKNQYCLSKKWERKDKKVPTGRKGNERVQRHLCSVRGGGGTATPVHQARITPTMP